MQMKHEYERVCPEHTNIFAHSFFTFKGLFTNMILMKTKHTSRRIIDAS